MVCPLCNQQTPEGSKFCERCGKKIPRCPTCGKVIQERIRFCDVDGTPIPEELVAAFGAPVRPQPQPIPAPVQAPPAAAPAASVQPAPAPVPKAPAAQPAQAPVRRQFCIKCGKPCRPGQDLCDSCMPQQEPELEPEAAPVAREKKRGKPFVIFLVIVILAAALVAGYSLLGNNDDKDDGDKKSSVSENENSQAPENTPGAGDNSQSADATRAPEPSNDATATAPTEKEITYEYRYEVIKSDMSWTEAKAACEAKGGYLATINSQEEYETICQLADRSGLTYLWLGACLPSENAVWASTGWIDGEAWTFENWYPGEPSKVDADGTKELYLCMWDAKYEGREIGWTFNDQRNDIVSAFPSVSGIVGYVCEYKVEVSG